MHLPHFGSFGGGVLLKPSGRFVVAKCPRVYLLLPILIIHQ